ncbi:MAG: mechanosensitive ion channel family protein [Melioribacteraceae bacterium]|nr:mechanosensitive ion channel family protein [Melioribacteraceae bacterium]
MQNIENIFSYNLFRLLFTLVVVVILYLIRSLINKVIIKRAEKLKRRYIARQINNYVILTLTILLIIIFWFQWFQSIITLLSLAVAAVIIVSKELILNFIAHGVIIMRGLFEAGDRIQVADKSGDVMDTGPLFFSISEIGNWASGDEATGRVIKFPNSVVLTQPISNYSRGLNLIWNEFSLQLTANSDLQTAKEIALRVLEKYSHKFTKEDLKEIQRESEEVMFTRTEPSVKFFFADGKMNITMRYPCKFHKRNSTQQSILEEVISEYQKLDTVKIFSV